MNYVKYPLIVSIVFISIASCVTTTYGDLKYKRDNIAKELYKKNRIIFEGKLRIENKSGTKKVLVIEGVISKGCSFKVQVLSFFGENLLFLRFDSSGLTIDTSQEKRHIPYGNKVRLGIEDSYIVIDPLRFCRIFFLQAKGVSYGRLHFFKESDFPYPSRIELREGAYTLLIELTSINFD